MPPLPPLGPMGTCYGSAMMPGHGVAHEWECLLGHHSAHPVSFLLRWTDEGEVGSEDQQGMPQTLKAGSPPGIYSQIASQWGSRRCPSLWSPNNPDLLGPSWWLLGVLPHLPVAEQEGSRCAAAARKHLGRARSLQPLPTLCLLHVLFQAHFFSSPTWESSCCPEPTATILYKVIFPLSAENNTKVIPSYQRFQKKPNTSLARFRFNLIISLKRGLFCLFRLFSGKQKCPFFSLSAQTSVWRSIMSCPTRGMVAPVFSHSTVFSSRGDCATGSMSFLTHDGGDWTFLIPSQGLLFGVCCFSCCKRRKV